MNIYRMPRKIKVVNIEAKEVNNDDITNNTSNNNESIETIEIQLV